MHNTTKTLLIITVLCSAAFIACTHNEALEGGRVNGNYTGKDSPSTNAIATPGKNFTANDVAKLKWLEGTWRGMDGDKPFYERYRIEGTAMIVEGLKEDGSPDGEPGRFELKDGEFGKGEGEKRSAASEIADSFVQFVPGTTTSGGTRRNSFRFERQSDGTWIALLEWPAAGDKPAQRKFYKMEPWQPKK